MGDFVVHGHAVLGEPTVFRGSTLLPTPWSDKKYVADPFWFLPRHLWTDRRRRETLCKVIDSAPP